MNTLTVRDAEKYIKDNYGKPRHNIGCLVRGIRKVAKQTKLNPLDLFHLMIENEPIAGAYTHSYGFHTREGRYLIESMQDNYYRELNQLN